MPYRFAIIGCGHIGQRHALQASRAGRLEAVVDILPEKAQDIANQYNTKWFASLSEMLRQLRPDVVCLCTPNHLHAPQAIACLEAGCHVLCEKPMCLSVTEGEQMLAAAARAGRRLWVVKQNRYNPPVQWVRQMLDAGRLGTVSAFELSMCWNRPASYYESPWKGKKQTDGGILFTQFSHFIDLLYWYLGDVLSVSGWRANYLHRPGVEIEDCGAAVIQMKSGAMGTLFYTVNGYQQNMEGAITLVGSQGTVKIGGPYLNRLEYAMVQNETPPRLPAGQPSNNYGTYSGSMSNHPMVYDNLVKALDQQDYSGVEASEALQSVRIIEQIYAASPFIQMPLPGL